MDAFRFHYTNVMSLDATNLYFAIVFVIFIHSNPLIFIGSSFLFFPTTLILRDIKFAFGKLVWPTLILGNHKFWSIYEPL